MAVMITASICFACTLEANINVGFERIHELHVFFCGWTRQDLSYKWAGRKDVPGHHCTRKHWRKLSSNDLFYVLALLVGATPIVLQC